MKQYKLLTMGPVNNEPDLAIEFLPESEIDEVLSWLADKGYTPAGELYYANHKHGRAYWLSSNYKQAHYFESWLSELMGQFN